ncbi:MAG TPA: helix-turn-helix transcriptional regulator [Anaerolineales bacterium]|nr:helix-turn-helix transcriptional regulator [Anaerolineales bacterium]
MPTLDSPEQPLNYINIARMRSRWETLSTIQQQVALLVIEENLSNDQIAGRLSLSLHTVKDHLSAVYTSLGVPNRKSLRQVMLFTKYFYELFEGQPASSAEDKTPPSPP